jgi:hypothetical protein
MDPIAIYQNKMLEASVRFRQCHQLLPEVVNQNSQFAFESCVLQLRKMLECIALASIAPNKKAYSEFRKASDGPSDFRKDFNGKKIIKMLEKVNPDFYPMPLLEDKSQPGSMHFTRRPGNYLTKANFESLYDRLSKFLHSDNPWGDNKQAANFISESKQIFESIFNLLECYFTAIRTPDFSGIWVVNVDLFNHQCRIRVAESSGDFVIIK